MSLVSQQRPAHCSERAVCDALSLCRRSVRLDRRRRAFCGPPAPRKTGRKGAYQPRALSHEERELVMVTMNSDTFGEQPPMQVYYSLLAWGVYLCSISTMHRLLREKELNGERRLQRPNQYNAVPRLSASRPNEVWTWDITKLATEKRGEYLSLYVVIDLYSRYIVAWMLSTKENSALSQQLIQEAAIR